MRKALLIISICCGLLTAGIEDDLTQVARYEHGQSRAALVAVEEYIRSATDMAALEQRFIAVLESDATVAGKDFICRQLSLMGSGNSVPVLARMLRDGETFEMARFALERIPGKAVDQSLREALPAIPSAEQKIGIINTLGNRGDPASVAFLEELSTDRELADSAIQALARIGNPSACKVVAKHLQSSPTAGLRCAEQSDPSGAMVIYRRLYEPEQPIMIRVAALRGMATIGRDEAVPTLQEALAADNTKLRSAALQELVSMPGREVTAILMSSTQSVQLLAALAERGDPSARPVLVKAAQSEDAAIRIAALEALGTIGGPDDVGLLAERSALATGREQEVARSSLYRLGSTKVDKAILKSLTEAEPKVKVELIQATGERAMDSASPALLASAREPDRRVRRAALQALRATATADDVPALIELLSTYERRSDRNEAQRTVASVIRRTEASIDPLMSAYANASDEAVQGTLLWVMGRVGHPDSLQTLRATLGSANADLKREAIVALSNWPDEGPATDLLRIAEDKGTLAHQVLAVRGYIQLVTLPSDRPHAATVRLLKDAAELATRPDEKKAILAVLPRYPCRAALDLARAAKADPAIAAEAGLAEGRILRRLQP